MGAPLLARLLALAPHVTAESRGGGTLVWVDGRGLPPRRLARAVLRAAEESGLAGVRVGVAAVPLAAEVAARWGVAGGGAVGGRGGDRPCTGVAPGAERAFLAAHPLAVLLDGAAGGVDAGAASAARRAAAALADAGVATCGALAALARAAVEARVGASGSALWLLARGEDRRVVFRHARGERPSASLDWTEFELRDPGPLVFAAGGLVARVCDALAARGEAARALALTFVLAGGGTVVRRVRSARDTADPVVWRRLVRAALERVGAEGAAPAEQGGAGEGAGRGLPDGVVGLALAVEASRAADAPQADLFDRGAASAAAAERAAARLVEGEWGAVVRPCLSAHPVPERRLAWEPVEVNAAVRAMTGATAGAPAPVGTGAAATALPGPALVPAAAAPPVRAPATGSPRPEPTVAGARPGLALVRPSGRDASATAPGAVPAAVSPAVAPDPAPDPSPPSADALRLRILPEPRLLAVTERRGRGHPAPARYRERVPEGGRAPRGGLPLVEVLVAAGPDRVVAGHADGAPVARDYWQCLTDRGALVLLYREAPAGGAPPGARTPNGGLPNGSAPNGSAPNDHAPGGHAPGGGGSPGAWYLHGWWD